VKIAILHPSYEGSTASFSHLDPTCDPSVYLPEAGCAHFHIRKATAVRQVTELARQNFDVIINLCDGAWDQDTAGIEVVHALERLNLPFTGAGSLFYDPTREAMKMAAHSAGVGFPAYVMVRDAADLDRALAHLRFPLLVKHPQGYASEGLLRSSRVTTPEELRNETARTVAARGAALVEEFIEGREFTVLVAEARHSEEEAWALEPVEFLFPPGETFKHFDLKWKDHESMETRAVSDPTLAARLREISALTFAALGGTGYGRCDIRMDAAGHLYLLEINPNCGVFYPAGQFGSADFILARDPAGHRGFLLHLMACATRRRDRARKPWEIRFHSGKGFGLFARAPIRAGELVEPYEESPYVLVSRRHAEHHWTGLKRHWFDRYAWPVTSAIHATWSADPSLWRPINHACDPNTWLEGLNVVARRDISAGEELTIDYATFCGPSMAPFACACGAPACRGTIRGSDCHSPELRERYRGHLSDFVRALAPEREYELEAGPRGVSLVARRAWRKGERIAGLAWTDPTPRPSRFTLQLSAFEHAAPVPHAFRYVNHSCAPNVFFDVDENEIRALGDIEPGDALTCFYPSTEWEMAEPFACHCGAPACLGVITGAREIPRALLESYNLSNSIRSLAETTDSAPDKARRARSQTRWSGRY